jgi:hypothetical protein
VYCKYAYYVCRAERQANQSREQAVTRELEDKNQFTDRPILEILELCLSGTAETNKADPLNRRMPIACLPVHETVDVGQNLFRLWKIEIAQTLVQDIAKLTNRKNRCR